MDIKRCQGKGRRWEYIILSVIFVAGTKTLLVLTVLLYDSPFLYVCIKPQVLNILDL